MCHPSYTEDAMTGLTSIVSLTDLKNRAPKIVREVEESGNHIALANKKGRAAVVMMSAAEYEKMRQTLGMLKLMAIGKREIEEGKSMTQAEAFRRARKEIGRARE